jgi:hypothetical protein
MRIVDDNNVRYPNLTNTDDGTLLHPNRAHFHVDELLNPSALGFSANTMTRSFYDRNGQFQTTTQALDNSSQLGQFDVHLFSGPPGNFTVPDQQTWKPLFYDLQNSNDMSKQNYLEIHVKGINTIPDRAFTVFLQPDVVPEPSSLVLLGVGAVMLTGCAWHHRRRSGLNARRPG